MSNLATEHDGEPASRSIQIRLVALERRTGLHNPTLEQLAVWSDANGVEFSEVVSGSAL